MLLFTSDAIDLLCVLLFLSTCFYGSIDNNMVDNNMLSFDWFDKKSFDIW